VDEGRLVAEKGTPEVTGGSAGWVRRRAGLGSVGAGRLLHPARRPQ
jgi:hypothetical protein